MSTRRILVVGSGGREHALAWRLRQDPDRPEVVVAPGNPGIARTFRCLPIAEHDARGLVAACRAERIDLAVIGPEAPLALGLADALAAAGTAVFGPSAEAARIESSKWFAKQLMLEAGVPTAHAESFAGSAPARAALDRFGPPWVIKADGLAAGKGVRVTSDRAAAETFLDECFGGRFGGSGRRVLIEEHLEGREATVMAVCDGRRAVLLPAARDHKRAEDGDRGENTGGMGAVAPVALGDALERAIEQRIVLPVLGALADRGAPFRGLLYCGLMLGGDGPRVIEFNARFGDPETEAVLPLVAGDLGGLLASAAGGALAPEAIAPRSGAAVAVALVAREYPGSGAGGVITGLERIEDEQRFVFFGAVGPAEAGWEIRGGRAAYVTARAADTAAARARAYEAIDRLGGTGWRCRRDVALDPADADAGVGATSGGRT